MVCRLAVNDTSRPSFPSLIDNYNEFKFDVSNAEKYALMKDEKETACIRDATNNTHVDDEFSLPDVSSVETVNLLLMSLMLYARASRNGFGFSPSSNCPNSTEALGDNFYHLYKNVYQYLTAQKDSFEELQNGLKNIRESILHVMNHDPQYDLSNLDQIIQSELIESKAHSEKYERIVLNVFKFTENLYILVARKGPGTMIQKKFLDLIQRWWTFESTIVRPLQLEIIAKFPRNVINLENLSKILYLIDVFLSDVEKICISFGFLNQIFEP